MPNVEAAIEYLRFLSRQGRGHETVHVVLVEEEQKKRIRNERKSTRFVLVCSTPEEYSELHAERERIYRKVKDKSIMIGLFIRALREGLSDVVLDQILAQLEIVEQGAAGPPRAEIPARD